MTGLEPATSGVTGRHSNQLSYTPSPANVVAREVTLNYESPMTVSSKEVTPKSPHPQAFGGNAGLGLWMNEKIKCATSQIGRLTG